MSAEGRSHHRRLSRRGGPKSKRKPRRRAKPRHPRKRQTGKREENAEPGGSRQNCRSPKRRDGREGQESQEPHSPQRSPANRHRRSTDIQDFLSDIWGAGRPSVSVRPHVGKIDRSHIHSKLASRYRLRLCIYSTESPESVVKLFFGFWPPLWRINASLIDNSKPVNSRRSWLVSTSPESAMRQLG